MMFSRNQDTDELDLKLRELETGATGKMLYSAAGQIAPRAEFVNALERKLGASALVPQTRAAWHSRPLWLVGAGIALVLLVVAVVWLNQPATASAHEILARAAAAQLAPNGFAHLVYTVEGIQATQRGGGADVWLQADAGGNIARTAMTWEFLNQDGSAHEIGRVVIDGDTVQQYDYNPAANTLRIDKGKYEQVMGGNPNYFDGRSVARKLEEIAAGNVNGVVLLAPQSYHDKAVYAVRTQDNGYATTIYFDAQTYILRGVETPETRVWMTQDESVAAAQVKNDAFDLNPPAYARVVTDDPFGSQYSTDEGIAQGMLVQVCHLTAAALDVAAARGKTLLAMCRESEPTMSADTLVGALMKSMKEKFDAAVKAGSMTEAKETESLNPLPTKLRAWLNAPFHY